MNTLTNNIDEIKRSIELGGGARFWAYISPDNHTAKAVPAWEVQLRQTESHWVGVIDSEDPRRQLQTPDLSGVFDVTVVASGPKFGKKTLKPLPDSEPKVGCNANCAAMIGIVATEDGTDAHYWTVWDAICK